MVRPKDPFWEHVKQLENKRFVCIYCGQEFAESISITRIKYHLSGITNRDTEICPEVPEDVLERAYQAIEAPNKKAKSVARSNNTEENESVPTSLPSSSRGLHQSITSQVSKKDQSEVDEMLAKLITLRAIDIDVIRKPVFVDFLKSIAEFGPSYKLPKFETLTSQLIPKIEEDVDKYIKNIKKSLSSTGYTVIFELWACGFAADKIVHIFVCTLEGAVLTGSVDLFFLQQDFIKKVCSIVNSFGHRSVAQFIIPNNLLADIEWSWDCRDGNDAESSPSIEDLLNEKYPSAYVTRCVAEAIQSLLMTIYREVPWVRKTIDLAYVIVKYLYKQSIDLSLGQEQLRSKNYGNDNFNQIASKFLMLTSILRVKRELQALQLPTASPSCEQKNQAIWTKAVAEVVYYGIHSQDFWTRGKELVQLLQPLFRVLRLVDGNGPTSGYLYEAQKMQLRRTVVEIKFIMR